MIYCHDNVRLLTLIVKQSALSKNYDSFIKLFRYNQDYTKIIKDEYDEKMVTY